MWETSFLSVLSLPEVMDLSEFPDGDGKMQRPLHVDLNSAQNRLLARSLNLPS
jgi:hypothetical protein